MVKGLTKGANEEMHRARYGKGCRAPLPSVGCHSWKLPVLNCAEALKTLSFGAFMGTGATQPDLSVQILHDLSGQPLDKAQLGESKVVSLALL